MIAVRLAEPRVGSLRDSFSGLNKQDNASMSTKSGEGAYDRGYTPVVVERDATCVSCCACTGSIFTPSSLA
jgi:hypothetical protein